ncbi:MAG: ABC transporter substrate-binding protein, partial [Gorillibacterium sp.]|nr:ABC transporter substrate-binding protein [Gorillibacterium sp.]
PYAAPLHPKWMGYYHQYYGKDIPVHLSGYRQGMDWRTNIALLQEARPDVIISSGKLVAEEMAMLKKLAPVYDASHQKKWREQLLATAAYLGEQGEADNWLEAYSRKVYITRNALKKELTGSRVVVVRLLKNNLYLYCSPTLAEVLYGDLGVHPAYHSAAGVVYDEQVQLEQLDEIDADRILLLVRQESETLDYWKRIQCTAEWKNLKAIRQNQLYCLPSDPWREYSPLAHERIVDAVRVMFSEK